MPVYNNPVPFRYVDPKKPFPFGKHKGIPYREVPAPYLVWFYRRGWEGCREKYPEVVQYIEDNMDRITAEDMRENPRNYRNGEYVGLTTPWSPPPRPQATITPVAEPPIVARAVSLIEYPMLSIQPMMFESNTFDDVDQLFSDIQNAFHIPPAMYQEPTRPKKDKSNKKKEKKNVLSQLENDSRELEF